MATAPGEVTGGFVPVVKAVGGMTIRALDMLPLPILIILFFTCMALVLCPLNHPAPLLPSHHSSPSDKSRFSPPLPPLDVLPLCPPFAYEARSSTSLPLSPVLGDTSQASTSSPPRYSPEQGRRVWVPRRGTRVPMLGFRGELGRLDEKDEKGEV
ncbi:hypothetical protein JCM24511_05435 [Saitozyma sp. JCM 24511]|nr:hypothetical protein JCM24511_05435 [Saitozyma sp. JCM 24511]